MKCSKCNVEKSMDNFYKIHKDSCKRVAACIDCTLRRTAEFREQNRDIIVERERKRMHNPEFRKKRTEKARENREMVLNKYGGKCNCCGIADYEFLALDHVNNDGKEHRKKVASGDIVRWIMKNNYPASIQVLCHNCNMAKAFYKICPHKK